MATASIRPPNTRIFVSLKYGGAMSFADMTLRTGNRNNGNKAVTVRFVTSEHQYVPMIRIAYPVLAS